MCDSPSYKKTEYSQEDFIFSTKMTFETLDIKAMTITWVGIYLDGGFENRWESIGNNLIIKDEDTLICGYSGTYFELDRIE